VAGNDVVEGIDETWRRSRLAGSRPLRLIWADLHNHSLLSDGAGDPERAFEQLRAAGLDAAALTDHASIPHGELHTLHQGQYPDPAALALARTAPRSVDDDGWRRTGELADAHDVPGEFTALRGFEWTEPWLGHVNVWFSKTYLPVTTPGALDGLHDFLSGCEPEALFGYNHPGREPGRLAGFALPGRLTGSALPGGGAPGADPADRDGLAELPSRMVSVEAFNRTDDFLFAGHREGLPSPIVQCLDAGWRPGLIGSSDEHGRSYGLAGKGRTGLWVAELSRDGVRQALTARRTFATREVGLRLDVTVDGVPMGGVLPDHPHARRLEADVAIPGRDGLPVELQLIGGRDGEVEMLARLPGRCGQLIGADLDLPRGLPWLLLRVADPARGYGGPAPGGHPAATWGLAYSSPWWTAA
jgi:hypothetical protein